MDYIFREENFIFLQPSEFIALRSLIDIITVSLLSPKELPQDFNSSLINELYITDEQRQQQ